MREDSDGTSGVCSDSKVNGTELRSRVANLGYPRAIRATARIEKTVVGCSN